MFAAVLPLMLVAALSSCALLPTSLRGPTSDNSQKKADVQMQHIADAVNRHDPAALKKLFSARALEKATDMDRGLDYFLSVFPSGHMTWKSITTNSVYDLKSSKETEELLAGYMVFADGKKYSLDFIDFPVNQVDDPKNVGLYALGVAPYSTDPYTAAGVKKPYYVWLDSFASEDGVGTGDPGVYVPPN